LQGQQFLRVLDAEDRLGGAGGFGQGGLGGGEVQLDELLDAFEGLGGQAEEGFDGGFLRGQDLFSGQHVDSPEWSGWGCFAALFCCSAAWVEL
jgi:hypothetical protein